jgi:hypothetical protein
MSRKFTFPLFVVVCVLAVLGAVTVFVAQAPPPEEGICDHLSNYTPGLYGLCVAFNEAQDCVPDYNLVDPFEGCTPAAEKILEVYNRKKLSGDPDMPGVVPGACRCFDQEMVSAIHTPYFQCNIDALTEDFDVTNISSQLLDQFAQVRVGATGTGDCSWLDVPNNQSNYFPVGAIEAQECRTIIVNTIEANQISCPSS